MSHGHAGCLDYGYGWFTRMHRASRRQHAESIRELAYGVLLGTRAAHGDEASLKEIEREAEEDGEEKQG